MTSHLSDPVSRYPKPPTHLTITQARSYAGVARSTIRRWCSHFGGDFLQVEGERMVRLDTLHFWMRRAGVERRPMQMRWEKFASADKLYGNAVAASRAPRPSEGET